MQHKKPLAVPPIKVKVGSLHSHQLMWFLASITATRDSNLDLPAPRPVALPLGHRVGQGIFFRAFTEISGFYQFQDFFIRNHLCHGGLGITTLPINHANISLGLEINFRAANALTRFVEAAS